MLGAANLDPANVAAYLEALASEKARRASGESNLDRLEPLAWARSFRGRPRELIAELVGPSWAEPSWTAWRAFLGALFGEELTAEELAYYHECTGLTQPPVVGEPRKEAWLPIGRRGGKSRILALIAVYMAAAIDWSPRLAPGERGFVVVLAAQRKQAQAIMGYVKATLAHRKLAPLVTDDLTESVALVNGVTIEVVTASVSAVRSRTVVTALCDEIAFWRSDEASANPDVEILNAIEPAMATIPEAMLLAASSPYAKRGALWETFKRYYGVEVENLSAVQEEIEDNESDDLAYDHVAPPLVWRAPTRTMNPNVPQRFINKMYRKDPIAAAAEYGAEFRSDVDAFLTREAVESLIEPGVTVRPPLPFGVRYRAFVDASGGMSDSMTLGIAFREPVSGNATLALLDEVRAPFNPDAVIPRFKAHLDAYRINEVAGDRYGGEWVQKDFRKVGVAYVPSELTATQIYTEFLPLVTGGRADLLDSPRLVDQLSSLERKASRSTNREIISHPPGGHDDLANAAAGVLVLVGARPAMVITADVIEAVRAAGSRRRALAGGR